ncbi:MAG: lipid-A-disaccharide synthase [Chitinispirillaceae bacterium]
MSPKSSVMFIAGDPSGDHHAASVIEELRKRDADLNCWGIGGPDMASQGFDSVMPFAPFNIMGFVEVARHLPFFLSAKNNIVKMMKSRRPNAVVCVDYPGFNMMILREARKLNIPVVWYIAPMVWAWKRKRAKTLGTLASHIAVIFPFEVPYFKSFNAPVSYVGNPITESFLKEGLTCFPKRKLPKKEIELAIVPGSRPQEIKHMLTPMLETAVILKQEFPQLKVSISKFSGLDESLFDQVSENDDFQFFSGPLRELLKTSHIALVTSGTASLETALFGIPQVIAYRTSALTYSIFKKLVRTPFIGLPNIIADCCVASECIQNDVSPQIMAAKLRFLLSEPKYYKKAVDDLSTLKQRLGDSNPSYNVAEIIYSYLGK